MAASKAEMEKAMRLQIEQRLKMQKIQEIHSKFDVDKDGFLNHTELSALQEVTSGEAMSRKKYKTICNTSDCKPAQGLTLNALVDIYAVAGYDAIDTDFDKVFGITRKKKPAATEQLEEVKEEVSPSVPEVNQESMTASNGNNDDNLMDLLKVGEDPVIESSSPEAVESTNEEHQPIKTVTSEGNDIRMAETAASSKVAPAPTEVMEEEGAEGSGAVPVAMEGAVDAVKSRGHNIAETIEASGADLHSRSRSSEDECCAGCVLM